MPEAWQSHPAVQRMARVARAIGDLREDVVFIGGAVAPLLQTHPPFPLARPTKDVDAMTESRGYADLHRLQSRLTAVGFCQNPADPQHIHRWVSPAGDWQDLVPAGDHSGGSGQRWDQIAIETSEQTDLGGGIIVRHASAPGFLGLKWAAHLDRGQDDPFASADLEDLFALIASRPAIIEEVQAGPDELAGLLAAAAKSLLQMPELDDLLAGHLNNAQDSRQVSANVKACLGSFESGSG